MPSKPSKKLETFANPASRRDYRIHMEIPEFTCLCPITGQPDFATLVLDFVPDKRCIELKSLKLYVWSFRNEGAFHEAVTHRILDDLVKAISPRFMRLTAHFYVRGGIFTTVVAEHARRGWSARKLPPLEPAPTPANMR
mgnify:FL=1|jgi:7-cyano-7-deazaguanine reductase